jgi:hypothetical protein
MCVWGEGFVLGKVIPENYVLAMERCKSFTGIDICTKCMSIWRKE